MSRSSENQNDEDSPQRSGIVCSDVCFPYNDIFVASSQILTILATVVLWMYWRTLIVSVFAMVAHQIIVWCYHMNKISIRALPVVSFLAALSLFSHGMITLTTLILDANNPETIYTQNGDDDDDGCPESAKVVVAFVAFAGAMFWVGSFMCMTNFVERGRNAKWQAMLLAESETPKEKEKNITIAPQTV